MSLKLSLFILLFSIIIKNGLCSYMGSETSLRKNIADLLENKLKYSDETLPFEKDELADQSPKNHSEYDFIVVGAGSAGATIASRLSEIRNCTILLIEAGGREYSIVDIPSLGTALWSNNDGLWNYETESSNKYCIAQKDHKCAWTRGKRMGGTSTINGMLAMRGNPKDYDEWVNETGDDSWSYKNMLKYFEKLENFDVNDDRKSSNKGGPVHITVVDDRPEISKTFIHAAEELGFSQYDYNGFEQKGFSYFHTTTFKGERWSSNRAYLRPIKDRKNLIVTQHSLVHKILIDKRTKNAYGVRYSKNNKIYEMTAKKEIILSAGAINSPQILMLSGIGPKQHLSDLKINVIKDVPVGENLIDHVGYVRSLNFVVNDSSTIVFPNILDPNDPSIKNYIHDKTGFLSYGNSMDALILFNVDNVTNLQPNIELMLTAGKGTLTNESIASNNHNTFGVLPYLMKPHSRGKILLRSKNPYDKPKIYANYFEDPEDIRVMIKGIRFGLKLGETNAMKIHGSEFKNFTSDCDTHGIGSDKYWECELRTQTMPGYHPVGTCKMGRESSKSSVVNSELKVIGVKGLRVADASIIPNHINAHINIPVIAIGEKAADLIKKAHGY